MGQSAQDYDFHCLVFTFYKGRNPGCHGDWSDFSDICFIVILFCALTNSNYNGGGEKIAGFPHWNISFSNSQLLHNR